MGKRPPEPEAYTEVSAQQLWNALVENTSAAVFVKDLEGRYRLVNRACERLWGVSRAELVGKTDSEVLPADSASQVVANDQQVLDSGVAHEFEERIVFPTGEHVYLASKSPLLDDAGRCVGLCGVATEITALKRTEDELRASQALLSQRTKRLARMHERKDEFLAVLAHELRNPLAPIAQAADLLTTPQPAPALVARAAGVVRRQVKHLVRLIDDLMDTARLTRGRIRLQRVEVDLESIVTRVRDSVAADLDARGHRLDVRLPDPPTRLAVDADRLVQVLTNLVENAARHNPEPGTIWLHAENVEEGLRLSVRDEGQGIEPSRLAELFDTFSRSGPPHESPSGGLGLGLSIVRQVVELHGGTVRAHSAGLGQGSEFVVTLPHGDGHALAPATPAPSTAAGRARRRLLVVDDNEDAAELLALRLRKDGHEVEVCLRATEVAGRFAEFRPDIVLLDLGMPEMDGFAVAEQLRSIDAEVRLFAVTGYGQDADRARTRKHGFERHLVKPVAFDTLARLLA